MKIFVTGCAGLLGANYTRHLLANGHHVVGIDDLSGGYKAFVAKGENFEFKKFNLERRKKVVELFEEHKPDVLVHFAAYAAEGLSPFIRNFNYRNNLICSANLINECINHKTKMIFTSSMAVYGGQQTEEGGEVSYDPESVEPVWIEKELIEFRGISEDYSNHVRNIMSYVAGFNNFTWANTQPELPDEEYPGAPI